MPATKGELEDTLRDLRIELNKGLRIAPFPGFEGSQPQIVLDNCKALALSASVLASDLPNNARSVAQAVGVVDSATPLYRTVRLHVSLSEVIGVSDARTPVLA